MKILAWTLVFLTVVLLAFSGGPVGVYDPLWIWLEPKLGAGWGYKGVLVEMVIVYAPAAIGCLLLWQQRKKTEYREIQDQE